MKLTFTVNGKDRAVEVPPQKRLLDILREDLGLTGSKEGCGRGECGSCTVLLNGRRVNSCLVPAFQLPGNSVITIEGLQTWSGFRLVEQAFTEHGAVQCGFCMPGYVMSAVSLLQEASLPLDLKEVKFRVAGNMCRCTGYSKILEVFMDLQNRKELQKAVYQLLGKTDGSTFISAEKSG
jgi:aerobic-type carbon monoxide dehydrogenase small subunit (CoxS/CutS family)